MAEAEVEWQAPSSFRAYLKELWGTAAIVKYVIEKADSPDSRPWLYQKYGWLTLNMILGLSMSWVMAKVFQGAVAKDADKALVAILGVATIFYAKKLVNFLYWRAHENLFDRSFNNLNLAVYDGFASKSPGQHKHLRALNHENMMKGFNRAREIYDQHLRELYEVLCQVSFAFGGIFFWISPKFGLWILAAVSVHLLLTLRVNYKLLLETVPIERDFSRYDRRYAEILRLFPRVYVSGKRKEEREGIESRWMDVALRDCRAYVAHGKRVSIQDLIIDTTVIMVIYQGTMWIVTGQWESIGLLYPLFTWSTQISEGLARLRGVERNIFKCIPSVALMRETLLTPADVVESPNAIPLETNDALTLEFENVSYAYPGQGETITNLSLKVKPGQKVALVGRSGSGKSTSTYFPLRFMDPSTGRVLIDSRDIRDYTIESVLAKIGYIPQEPLIFDGTVRSNILYGLPEEMRELWSDERLLELMHDLSIDFGARPAGENMLDIVVGRDGVKLSGGQAQRLAIGAVVIREPRLMIVDEATSALDTATETELLGGLRKWIDGAGMLVIAHRLSTVRDADVIVVMADGKVEAIGNSFEELVKTSPTFRQLISGQSHLLSA